MHHYHKFGVRLSFQFLTFMFSIGWSVCIYELCRDVVSVVNLSYPFSMQVIDQDEPRQRIIGLLAEEVYCEESH